MVLFFDITQQRDYFWIVHAYENCNTLSLLKLTLQHVKPVKIDKTPAASKL